MAKLLDADLTMDFPIARVEKDENGDLFVYGKATDGSIDSDDQIVDSDFTAKAIADWLATGGNVRVQHSPYLYPAGVGVELDTNKDGGHWVKSKVVEPTAKRLVEEGVLRAYSVGIAQPKIIRDNLAKNGRVVGGRIVEISLVDRPANANCAVKLVKADGDGNAARVDELALADDVLAKYRELTEVDLTKAGATHGAFTGTHSHAHDANGASGGDEMHSHAHSHDGDGDHGHDHGKAVDPDLEKKDVDPNVGGGVDRDKIPAEDFAGKNRSFPIVTPGDVADAASSIGRAGDDNYSSEQLKANIIRIAKRKGPSFVAKLPDSWKEDEGKAAEPDLTKDAIPADKDVDTKTPQHHEPDGDEDGPDLDRDGDGASQPATKTTYSTVRMHDAFCAAYRPDDVLAAYPTLKSVADALDDTDWREAVIKATEKWDLDAIAKNTTLLSSAAIVRSADRAALADARAELSKAFEDAHPGVHVMPRQTVSKADIPAPSHVPDAGDFARGPITDGHESVSPASSSRRVFYTNSSRDSARSAMQAMHDHIASTFPDLCPMGTKAATAVAQQPNGAANSPRPAEMPATTAAPGEKTDIPQLIKSLVDERLREEREYYGEQITYLRSELEKLGAEPDPAKAPVRGVLAKAVAGGTAPVERHSLVDDARKAQVTDDEYHSYLETLSKSGDPSMREQARATLRKMLTVE